MNARVRLQALYNIIKPLSHMFNLSIQLGIFSEKLKISRTLSTDNYR